MPTGTRKKIKCARELFAVKNVSMKILSSDNSAILLNQHKETPILGRIESGTISLESITTAVIVIRHGEPQA